MHLILLSGGSGKRLWPLSNDVRSKQFLKVLPAGPGPNAEEGLPESMVQRVFRQLSEVGGWSSVTIAAGASQADILGVQIGKRAHIVVEPERRDTFPAIALACSFLHSELGVREDEPVAILPVDPFVNLEYFRTIKQFAPYLEENRNGLILMGATPSLPSVKYGYILLDEKEEAGGRYKRVKHFKEKPDLVTAKEYCSRGALWNCGVFGLNLCYIKEIMREKYDVQSFDYATISKQFASLKKTSFDYEVVEHAEEIAALVYDGAWKDLGTWETLTDEMGVRETGNVITDGQCGNTHIINELDIPLVAMNTNNLVVVASNDGILVAEKGKTPALKELIADLQGRPMYEEKRWGVYKVLDHRKYEDLSEALTKHLKINAGMQLSYQFHRNRREVWSIVRGEGIATVDGEEIRVATGAVITMEKEQKHSLKAVTELELIEVQLGNPLVEEDIVRL